MVGLARRKESALHTITVSIQGDVSVAESVEVNDAEALPLFIRLKSVLQAEGAAQPVRRRGRPRKERPAADDAGLESIPQESDTAEPTEA
jgi:hypothetical protein